MTSRSKKDLQTAAPMTITLNRDIKDFKNVDSKTSFYLEKQNQLSDWYYIKTKKEIKVTERGDDVLMTTRKQSSHANIDSNRDKYLGSQHEISNDSLQIENNNLNYSEHLQTNSSTQSSKSESSSLNRKVKVDSRRFTETIPQIVHKRKNILHGQNNFNKSFYKDLNQHIQYDVESKVFDKKEETYSLSREQYDPIALQNKDVDYYKNSELSPLSLEVIPLYKKDIGPQICIGQKETLQEKSSSARNNGVFSKVNVRLLMQQYQQNQQKLNVHAPKENTDNENENFEGCAKNGFKNGLKLTDLIASKNYQKYNSLAPLNTLPEDMDSCIGHQRQQQQNECNCGNCRINKKEKTVLDESHSSSDNQNRKRSNISHIIKLQQQYPANENTQMNDIIAQGFCFPTRETVSRRVNRSKNQPHPSTLKTELVVDPHLCLPIKPCSPIELSSVLLTDYPPAALTSRQIQNCSDDTILSDIAQLKTIASDDDSSHNKNGNAFDLVGIPHQEGSRTQQNVVDIHFLTNKSIESNVMSTQGTTVQPLLARTLLKINEEHECSNSFETRKSPERVPQLEKKINLQGELKEISSSMQSLSLLQNHRKLNGSEAETKDGNFFDAPKRCLIECTAWVPRSNLCLRIAQTWAKEPPWPSKGTPVALVLFIPLAEVKRSFASYIEKEIIAKGSSNPFKNCSRGFSAAWASLVALGPKLLFILDGYDSQKLGYSAYGVGSPKKYKSHTNIMSGANKHHYPNDVHELLDGKLFPDSRVIITTSTGNFPELLPIIQRHLIYEGLTWGRSATLLGGSQWGGPSMLLDAVQENIHLRKVVRTSLGCLATTAVYETNGGSLPIDEMDIVESILNCVAPETTVTNVSELGRLALFCLKMKRPYFTSYELRMYCSTSECSLLGCFDKNLLLGRSAKKKGEYVFYPICAGMMEFLAANYIASLASRPGILAAEITGMAVGDELVPDLFKVLKFAMTILGDRAHILLSRLTPLWLTPQTIFTLALASGHAEENMAALCDILGISKHPPLSPLETKPLWVQVRSLPTDLMGWGMALKSPSCTLKNLEVIYQLEKHNQIESRKAIEIFLDSIIYNESVSTLRISSLIEMDVKDSELNYLANFVSKILLKPRLENFELVLTLLEEDPPTLKLQSVVTALCRTISRQPKLSFLLLDVTLNTSQIVQLCSTLEKCTNVTRLSLPHLRCERGAIAALASLVNSRPISFLSLPSSWGARDDPPSSSGVSMGSGSGSSTGTSGLIKQGSLPGAPSPRSYAPGVFSSLPRGVFLPQSSLGRSATLPRQPLEHTLDKRSFDSVVSKNWYPTPACDGGPHNSGTLHDLFAAARDSFSKLHGLDLSKAQLSLEDSMCLGETVRLSKTLHTLKLEGSSRLSEVLPSVLGASDSSCLQMLSIGSPRLNLEDTVVAMVARALTRCSTLRLLSVDGWSFRIENSTTFSIFGAFLTLTSIRELSLSNCRLHINLINIDSKIDYAFQSRSVVVLKLAGAQATLADSTIIGGPQLLQFIGCFPGLRELDLSAPGRSGMSGTHTTPLIIDDKCVINFFQNLHSYFGLLNTLKICNWVIHFDDLLKTLKTISKCLRNSPISHLKMDGISVLDRPKKQRSEVNLMHCFISSLPLLRWMGISLAGKKENQIISIGNAVLDLKASEIDIKLSESTIEHAKLMAQAISLDGKFDIKVSTFGTSSGILVHAEKSGAKTLTPKTKE